MDEADALCSEVAILKKGRLLVSGTPTALKGQVGDDASMDDVFVHFTGGEIESPGAYRATAQARRTAARRE